MNDADDADWRKHVRLLQCLLLLLTRSDTVVACKIRYSETGNAPPQKMADPFLSQNSAGRNPV